MEDAKRKFSEEAAKVQTVEELMELAEAYGIETTEEEARLFLSLQNNEGVLSDETLDGVSGGERGYKCHEIVSFLNKCYRFELSEKFDAWQDHCCGTCAHVDSSGLFMMCKLHK